MNQLDMNEQDTATEPVNSGVPIAKLLEIIGKQVVEWIVNEEAVARLKEQATLIYKQNATLTAELTALKGAGLSPELEQLRKADAAHDLRVRQLENQVNTVATERDAAQAELKKAIVASLKTAVVKGKKK